MALPFTVLQLFPASGRSMRRLEEEQAGLYKWVEDLLDRWAASVPISTGSLFLSGTASLASLASSEQCVSLLKQVVWLGKASQGGRPRLWCWWSMRRRRRPWWTIWLLEPWDDGKAGSVAPGILARCPWATWPPWRRWWAAWTCKLLPPCSKLSLWKMSRDQSSYLCCYVWRRKICEAYL